MTERPDTARFLPLVEALVDGEVEFVIVGGVAAVLGGVYSTTIDLDIVPATGEANLRRLLGVLEALDALYRDPAGRRIEPTIDRLSSPTGHHRFATRLGPLDVLMALAGERSYRHLRPAARLHRIGDRRVAVLDLPTLLLIKRETGRPKDLLVASMIEDALALRSAQDEESP